MAEYDRGMVAAIAAAGASRDRFRRQSYEIDYARLCEEGRYSPVESQSEAVGVRTTSKAAEAWEAHFCVPSLRNGALGSRCAGYGRNGVAGILKTQRTGDSYIVAQRELPDPLALLGG